MFQDLQCKLHDSLPVEARLRSLCAELRSASDADQCVVGEVDSVCSRYAVVSADVDANVDRLETQIRLCDDVRAELDAVSEAVRDAQQLLTADVPSLQLDLQQHCDALQVVTVID